jgi:hypothetical protein
MDNSFVIFCILSSSVVDPDPDQYPWRLWIRIRIRIQESKNEKKIEISFFEVLDVLFCELKASPVALDQKKIKIPDPGVKNAGDFGSGSARLHATLCECNQKTIENSVADPDPGSGIGYLFEP